MGTKSTQTILYLNINFPHPLRKMLELHWERNLL